VGDLAKVEPATALAPAESETLPVDKPPVDALAVGESSERRNRADAANGVGLRQQFQFTNTRLQSPATSSVSAPPSTRQAAASVRASGDTVRRETATASAASPAGQPAPASAALLLQGDFQVVIEDGQIALVDADQSSYAGRLEPVDPASLGTPSPQRSLNFEERYHKFVQNGVPQVVPRAAQFVLSGTNRTTQLPVQIVGQMVTRTQAVPNQVSGAGGKLAVAPQGVVLQINATATVNGGAPVQIDASAQPQ
jgi:hypothetical protein